MADQMQLAHKVTLSTGRVVMLREMKIKYQNLASQAVGKKAEGNTLLMATLMQQELLKVLLISVDDKPISGVEREDLDSVFSFQEFGQIMKVISKISGGDEGEAQTEIASIGTR